MKAVAAFAALNVRRAIKDWSNLVFSVVLPVLLYLIFGAAQDFGGTEFPGGNVMAFVMVGLALYAGIAAAVSGASSAVLENNSGWGRQLALTPMTPQQIVVAQALVMLARAFFSVSAVYLAGALTGAEMSATAWASSFALAVVACLPFGFYGLAWVQLVPNEATVAMAASSVVMLAFAGNLFLPLSAQWLEWARFTPVYGAAALARYPVSEGYQVIKDAPFVVDDPLKYALLNVAAWTAVFVCLNVALSRRDKKRA